MSDFQLPVIDRRTTLAWLAAAASWSGLHHRALAVTAPQGKTTRYNPVAKGYGTDPNLVKPRVTWERTMSQAQRQQYAVLADTLLPPAGAAPAPSAAGVTDYLDEWISAPYAQQRKDRPVILDGLAGLEAESQHRFGKAWVRTSENERTALLDEIARAPAAADGERAHHFFLRARALTVGIYYCTEVGWRDIGYVGNVPLTAFPPVAPEVAAIIEGRLKKLGLTA